MRIVFLGTPEFATATLAALIDAGFEVVGVVTAPDKPAGRGQVMHESDVKHFALSKHLTVLQPANLKDAEFIRELRSLRADVQVVVAFRMLPEAVWSMPSMGTFNLHASLLPKYRGAAPINWAVINGEKETGVTTFKLRHEIDTGTILLQEKVVIEDSMNAGELHDRLKVIGAKLMVESMRCVEKTFTSGIPLKLYDQQQTQVSHAPKIFRDTCKINWNQPVQKIRNLVRGLSPYPGAFGILNEGSGITRTLKLFDCSVVDGDVAAPGTIETDHRSYLRVRASNGWLTVHVLQLEGKKRMSVAELLKGYRDIEKAFLS